MDQEEHSELLALQRQLEGYLVIVEDEVIAYPIDGDDIEFDFLLQKATYYQRMLTKIKRELSTNEDP